MPVATCTPCVTRYRPTGRDGTGNHATGCWWRCENTPVTKHVVNITPNAAPNQAATRSSRNALWNRPCRRGRPGSVVMRSTTCINGLQVRVPPTLDVVQPRQPQPGDGCDLADRVGADHRPVEPRPHIAAVLHAHPPRAPAAPRRLDLHQHGALAG